MQRIEAQTHGNQWHMTLSWNETSHFIVSVGYVQLWYCSFKDYTTSEKQFFDWGVCSQDLLKYTSMSTTLCLLLYRYELGRPLYHFN